MPVEVYVGRIRSAVLLIFLSILTLGLWAFVWLYQLNRDLKRHLKTGVNTEGRLTAFLLLPVIGWFFVFFLTGRSVRRAQLAAGTDRLAVPLYPAIFGSLVPVVGWVIALAYLQGHANVAWARMSSLFEPGSLADTTIQCPDCDTRFATLLNPLMPHPVRCPQCGRTGDV